MRISSARSADDTALAAKAPQAAAARRYLDALSNWAAMGTALSSLQAGAQLSLGHRRLLRLVEPSRADDLGSIHPQWFRGHTILTAFRALREARSPDERSSLACRFAHAGD
jgi:hypothetical protein